MVRTRNNPRKSYNITAMQKAERKRTNNWRKEAYAERQKTKTRRRKNRKAKKRQEKRLHAQWKKAEQERLLNNKRLPLLERLLELSTLCQEQYGMFIYQERIDDILDIHDHKSINDYMEFDHQCIRHLFEVANSILVEEKDTSIEGMIKRYNNLLYKMAENVDLDALSDEDRVRYSKLMLSN